MTGVVEKSNDRFCKSAALRAGMLALALSLVAALPATAQRGEAQDWSRFTTDAEVRDTFAPVIRDVRAAVVKLMVDGDERVLGTIIDAEGHILSKASELNDAEQIVAFLSDGRQQPAELIGIDRLNDLAMLKIDADQLRPVTLVDDEPAIGRWVVCAGQEASPLAVGIVSAKARAVAPPQLVLGVVLRPHPQGLMVMDLSEGFGAAEAGIEPGDIIVQVEEKKVLATSQVIDRLSEQAAGDVVGVTLMRGDLSMQVNVRLSELLPDPESRGERMNRMGGDVSSRNRGFERVIQHDAEIDPHQCGGPIVNLEGKVVGLNIARAGRIASYALPTALISAKLEPLKSGRLAPHPTPLEAHQVADPKPEPAELEQ